jgi:hypothetical protein
MVAAPGHAPLPAIKILHRDRFPAPRQIVPRQCASARNQLCNQGQIRGSDQICTATLVMLTKLCTWTAKSAPYPPCTPAAHPVRAGRGVTAFWLKFIGRDRCLRRVTQPPHIAGPLAIIVSQHYQ